MQTRDIGIILLIGLLVVGITLGQIPFTEEQFYYQNTDINYLSFIEGNNTGNFLIIDGNKISTLDFNILDYNLNIDLNDYVPYTGATTTVNLGSEILTTDGQVQADSFFGNTALLWDITNAVNGAITMLSKDAGNSVTVSATNSVSDIHGSKLFQFMSGQNKFQFVQSPLYSTYFMIDVEENTPVLSSYTNDINIDDNVYVNGMLYAQDYYSEDGTQGMTGTCVNGTSLEIKDGLVVGCS